MELDKSHVKETFEVTVNRNEDGAKIINNYKKLKTLGRGSYSKVIMMEDLTTKQKFAVKIVNKRELERKKKGLFKFGAEDQNNSLLQDAMREIAILKKMDNPNIIKLHEIMYDDEEGFIYLVMECCDKGSIMKYDQFTGEFSINPNFTNDKKRKFDYSEVELRDILRGIILGIEYLHHNNIVHRDIKPDNILIGENNKCKITDFNVSKMLENGIETVDKKVEGTMYFMAPECCDEEAKDFAGKPLDIWALGVTAYILAFKELPFKPENPENILELLDMIADAAVTFPETRYISEEFIDFLSRMFEKDPFRRITIEELKEHPWININRTPLNQEKAHKITVSENEIKSSLSFFSIALVKKVSQIWKAKSLKKRSTGGSREIVLPTTSA